jgi:tetratricopeptide (TPR) repeat protein
MSNSEPLPRYIPRTQEQRSIIAEAARVRATGQSRAVLLYGRGGTGKTRLVRQLPRIDQDPKVIWLDPIGVDDSQHWLLSNLERYIASQLDPDSQYFSRYLEYVSELPRQRLTPISRETVLSHLNRIKAVFTECYESYIDGTGNTVVVTFDTVEAIRSMHFLRTLTQWMKALPGTLFILAGRPLSGTIDQQDSISKALQDPPLAMAFTTILLGEFNAEDCWEYLSPISKEAGLSEEEAEKLVYLTQGHPLWLALTVDYLTNEGLPKELRASLEEIKRELPYHGEPTIAGRDRVESFKGHLVAPYQRTDFWHEAIRRLAVLRESVSQPIWLELMADRPLPADVADPDRAWEELRATEWIRPRANHRYVTLHDVVAEELAQRVIGLHDPDQRQRRELWRRAAGIYADRAGDLEGHLAEKRGALDTGLRALNAAKKEQGSALVAAADEAELIRDVAELDGWTQELNQLIVARLFYQLLSDYRTGAQQFVALLRRAREQRDVLFEDMLTFQMQRFLPSGVEENTVGDTVAAAISSFRDWLQREGQDNYVDIGLEMAAYLIDREHLDAALNLLDQLPVPPDHKRRYRLRNLQGNACLRTPGRVREGGKHFQDALTEANQFPLPDQRRYRADAYKELGFYYRNIGQWKHAEEAYRKARDAIAQTLSRESPTSNREEMASIQTNWAYVKGIGGRYDDGINLVESAIIVRRRSGRRHEQAISCSVKGEVYRYQRQFKEAWEAYAEAEQLFREQNSWSWLGVIYQEQAICLFQSIPVGVQLLPAQQDPAEQAESLILRSLDICKILNARAYPSALNRAGRIFGDKDPELGLGYLRESAERARDLSDGWFWIASLVEYAELCYRAWSETRELRYLEQIRPIAGKLQETKAADIEFAELRGRWSVLQGHLALHQALATGSDDALETALENYRSGFPLIVSGWVGSYGASAILREFRKFRDLVRMLPRHTREHWQQELYRSWSGLEESASQLLESLEELY